MISYLLFLFFNFQFNIIFIKNYIIFGFNLFLFFILMPFVNESNQTNIKFTKYIFLNIAAILFLIKFLHIFIKLELNMYINNILLYIPIFFITYFLLFISFIQVFIFFLIEISSNE